MSQPGRNEACPCGSGKKFKHCCLGKPEEAGTELGRLAHRLNAEEGHVAADIVEWAQRRFGTKWAVDALAEVLDGPAEDDDSQFFMPWLIYHRHLDGATPAARYEAERGP